MTLTLKCVGLYYVRGSCLKLNPKVGSLRWSLQKTDFCKGEYNSFEEKVNLKSLLEIVFVNETLFVSRGKLNILF